MSLLSKNSVVRAPQDTVSYSTSGSSSNGLVFIGNELTFRTTGNGIGVVGDAFVVPIDHVSGGSFKINVRRSGAPTAHTMKAFINDVIDSTINVSSIIATADVTWEVKTLTLGSTIKAGDVINLEYTSNVGAGVSTYIKGLLFTYNDK